MTRSEISKLAEPDEFQPFVIITSGGTRYSIDHPDYIDIPPIPEPEADEETFRPLSRFTTEDLSQGLSCLRT